MSINQITEGLQDSYETDWVFSSWYDIKAYKIEFNYISGVKMQRHHWMLEGDEIKVDEWIRAA